MPPTLHELRRRVIAQTFFVEPDLQRAVARLGFVQADPIRAPARAQDLILRQRVESYRAGDLESRYPELDLEEDFLYAYGFVTRPIWNALHPRPRRRLGALEKRILEIAGAGAPLHPKILQRELGQRRVVNAWGGFSQATTRALEALRHDGLLRVARRDNGARLYEPARPLETSASPERRFQTLALAALRVAGPTEASFLLSEVSRYTHLLKSPAKRRAALAALRDGGRVGCETVDGIEYLWLADAIESETDPDAARFLAPFDPLARDRDRFERLWGWTYRFEAYTPAAKRRLGYYALPVLWREDMIGWANARVESGRLRVELGFVRGKPNERAFAAAIESEASRLAKSLGLEAGAFEIGAAEP